MVNYLDFKDANCKDCYKCLRECPVKAIEFKNHQARIIEDRCILCGRCTNVCPQNAKKVHEEKDDILSLLKSDKKIIASIAPSFVASFKIADFSVMKKALLKLGFFDAEETAVGAKAVTEEYAKLLAGKKYKILISSACPAVNDMISKYYPKALNYLAPVLTPMAAHAKILKKRFPDCEVVFIGPCIAKKKEGRESGLISGVLTFEELDEILREKNIDLKNIPSDTANGEGLKARYYPIQRGIIKSFEKTDSDYEYIAVDGVEACKETLENIDKLDKMFLELNACQGACINGPCALPCEGGLTKAVFDVRKYAKCEKDSISDIDYGDIDFSKKHKKSELRNYQPSEKEIKNILAKTGKLTPEDELNCGSCGYSTCREKAWAVACGFADIEMCVPYMRKRAESMSFEVIKNSPNGIVVMDNELKIIEINDKAKHLWGVKEENIKGRDVVEFVNPTDFVLTLNDGKNLEDKKVYLEKTKKFVKLSVILLKDHNMLCAIMKDITEETMYDEKLNSVKLKTLSTTDEVIRKQMRVAQEIASLLGETTAETKVALLQLKKTLQSESGEDNSDDALS